MLILEKLKTTKYMNIKFYWSNPNEAFPCCSIANANKKTINCISGLLIDTGGCGIQDSLAWLEVGINILKKNNPSNCWDRDTWGSEILKNHQVRIYSLYDDEYCIYLPLEFVIELLSQWLKFHLSDTNSIVNLEYLS